MKYWVAALLLTAGVNAAAQTANPTIAFFSSTEEAEVVLSPGESQTAAAPLDIACSANIDDLGGTYRALPEWRVYKSDEGEDAPVVTRFDAEVAYTLVQSGGYGAKLYVTFVGERGDTIEYESEPFSIVISESRLTCPDGFSPNGDGINDVYHIEFESIVKASGMIFNRWGKKLHTFTLANLGDGWDGRQGGDYVKDGVYYLTLDAVGSDGLHYQIKKAINVLKGFRETDTTSGE